MSRQDLNRTSRKALSRQKTNVVTQKSELASKGQTTLSRHRKFISRKTQHKVELNSVATKPFIVVTKVEKNYKKNFTTQKLMLRHNEELKVEIFVATIKVVE